MTRGAVPGKTRARGEGYKEEGREFGQERGRERVNVAVGRAIDAKSREERKHSSHIFGGVNARRRFQATLDLARTLAGPLNTKLAKEHTKV